MKKLLPIVMASVVALAPACSSEPEDALFDCLASIGDDQGPVQEDQDLDNPTAMIRSILADSENRAEYEACIVAHVPQEDQASYLAGGAQSPEAFVEDFNSQINVAIGCMSDSKGWEFSEEPTLDDAGMIDMENLYTVAQHTGQGAFATDLQLCIDQGNATAANGLHQSDVDHERAPKGNQPDLPAHDHADGSDHDHDPHGHDEDHDDGGHDEDHDDDRHDHDHDDHDHDHDGDHQHTHDEVQA